MSDDGLLARGKKKRVAIPGKLPPVTVLDVVDRDPDGELIARPARWDEDAPPPRIVLAPLDKTPGPALGIGERVLARLSRVEEKDSPYAYEGRIIRRLGHSAHRVLGVYRQLGLEGRVHPVDRKSRFELRVRSDETNGAKTGDLVFAELRGESDRRLGLKQARIQERLGSLEDPRSISLIAVHMHGIPTEFPAAVLKEAEDAKPVALGERRDLRDLPLVTIDPDDARDHDDAVYAEMDDNPANPGGVVIWVAIADVAHYVTPGSALDREALKRGNSTYFPDRVIPMLPERLSTVLCSLTEGDERACLAVRMVFDSEGRKRSHRFSRGLMRSPASLTYSQVQAAIDGAPDAQTGALLESVIKPLYAAFAILDKEKNARSPLDLDLPEFRVEIGANGHVAGIAQRARLDAHRLIEEFMIQANVAAAEALEERHAPVMYRVHEPPAVEKLVAFSEFLKSIGINVPKGQGLTTKQFNQVLKKAEASNISEMVSEIILRTQSQAYYAPRPPGHFGLHLQRYAHFTSPIRRYADLVVHRSLIRSLKLSEYEGDLPDLSALSRIGEEISALERRSMAAERESKDRYIAAFMQDRLGGEFVGRISGVTRFGLFVRLLESGADGLIPISSLGQEYFHHEEHAHALIGQQTGLTFKLGAKLTVRLIEAAPITGGLRFELVEGGVPGEKPRGKGHRRSDGARRAKPKRGMPPKRR
jgi:ribonuclease R